MIFNLDWEPVALTGVKTLALVTAAANRPVWIRELCIGFDGITSGQVPIEIQIKRASAAGTASARTLVPLNGVDGNTIQATASTVFTVEPTYTILLKRFYLHGQTPPLIWQPPQPEWLSASGGGMIGIYIATTSISPTVNCVGYLSCEE